MLMQNIFSKCREWVPRGTRTIWRYLGALFILFTFAVGNVWAAEGDPVSFVPSAFATYSTARAIVSTNDANLGTIYYGAHATPSTVTLADSKKSYRLRSSSIVINIPARSKIDVVYAGTTARNVFVGLYEVTDASAYLVWQRAAGYSGHVAAWLNANANSEKAADGVTTMYDYFRAKGVATSSGKISSNSSVYNDFLLQNDGSKITLGTNSSKFYTKVWEADAAISIPNGSVPKKIEVNAGASIPAGKYLLCVGDNGSNVGIKEIVITPVYQLTWDFDGGSTSAVAGDDYTAAGYYEKGASLTYPENSTMSKTSYIFTDWSSSATAMPASALTITAQWALAGSAYNVNIASMTNGSVVASPASQVEDGTVTLTVTPDDGYLLSSLSVVGDVSGDEVTVTANQFTMPAEDVTVNATFSLAPTYTVTLNPAGGTIVDATGWTLNAGNYEKEVAEGTVLTLPTFTKDNRTFKTWRNGVPADVASPVTVDGDLSLTAIWTATIEQGIYSWESPDGTPIEVGGTAKFYNGDTDASSTAAPDNRVNYANKPVSGDDVTQYYTLRLDKAVDYSAEHVRIALDNALAEGDKIKITAYYTKNQEKTVAPKIANGSDEVVCSTDNLVNLYNGGTPVTQTKTLNDKAEGATTLKLTRSATSTTAFITKLQIIREVLVEEANIRTVTFNYNDGGATANKVVEVASGATVSAEAAPSYAHHRFHEWQLGGVAYNFATAVTSNITLTADWTQLYTVTYAKGAEDATGDAPTQDELAAGEKFTVAANPFAYEGHDFSTWNDGSKDVAPASEYTMGAANVTLTAQWITATTKVTVTYKDGETTLGSEEITINTGHPAEYATYQTRNLATFDGWYNDPDLAEGHKIADISALTASVDVNVYGKWNYQYASSANIEQWTLDNGKGVSDAQKETQTGALMSLLGTRKYASNIAYDKGNIELDSLNDDPGKTNRNNAYLGLKVKKSGKMLDFRLAKDSYVKVKFGNVAATPQVSINGADYADMEITDGVYSYTATGNDYISIKTASDGAVVFKQIMINEEIQNVILPAIVTLDANGGTYADASVKYTGTALVIGDATPADEYHVFAGWFDGDDQINATAYVPTKNVTLQAHYAPKPYSITYMPNGGSGAEFITDDNATEVAEGTLFTAPASSAFVEWNTQADGNGDSYLPGAAVTADLTLFAQWKTSYTVTFDLQGHGDAIDLQNIVSGGKVVKPADPSADAWEFGGWYKESTCENEWDFATDVVTTTTTIFAKWTADPCPTPFSLSKVVLTSASDGTVTGYNNDEYAGEKVIGGLNSTETAEVDPSHEGTETGYKLNSGGSAIVFATLRKGTFQVGDRVVVTITKKQDAYKVEEVAQPILDIYYGTDKNDATFLTTIENVTAAGSYTYRLTAADVTAIGSKKGIGVFRPSSGRTQNPYVYSVEIKGCREWAIFHTLTFKNIDGTATIAAESLEEGAYASTVAPAAPKITLKRFLGWAEATDGTPVDLTTYTITEDKILYAVYEDIVCPTNGTVYKFEIKDELASENLPTITDKDMSSYITATGDGYLTYTATANNKATINSDGIIQMKDASAAYLKVELECALAAGDQIRAHVTNNPMRVQVGTTYDSDKDLILAKNAYEFVAITSAMEGKQVLYITRSSNGNANLADFEIYRPAKYDVSFNMMGHGSAIADLEDVVEGSKIAAPSPAPTDVDYSFAGWYKENTLENEWKFDVDVVETNTTLYAKWLDKSDATLKSLKYGETEIALEAGVYTYNVSLPAFTSAVPALTAETSNPNATKVIANAAAFDNEGNATSTVTVTPEVGADQVYYVNFAKGVEILLQDVTGSITWNFANAVTGTVNITGTPQVLANYGGVTNDNTFESDKLEASGEKFTAGNKANLRANYIHFHTTVPGMLTISYSNTGDKPARYIYVNGAKYDEDGSANTTPKGADNKVFVPAGDVELVMMDGEGASKNVQIYQMIFNATPDYTRPVTEGRYGTICLPNGGVMTGASIYTLAYYGETSQKIFFDEVLNGTMEAGKPYLFLPNEGIDRIGVFYTDAAGAEAQTVNGFVGYIGASEDPEDALLVPAGDGNYIVQNNQYREILAGATAYILSHRAYIHFAGINTSEPAKAPGARRIGISGAPQVVTGVDGLNVGDQPVKLIIDGQMYILRGDKMYDATGRLVK